MLKRQIRKVRPPRVGDRVTCRITTPSYDSRSRVGHPYIGFEPGMVGVVRSVAAKVIKYRDDSGMFDGKDDFLVVDFVHPTHGEQRVGLNYCNAVIVEG